MKYNRVLLMKRGALGDVLMATPLIRQLKTCYPQLCIDFLVSEECKISIANNPYLTNIIAVKNDLFSISKIFQMVNFVAQLRYKYDYVFILDKHYYFNFLGRIISENTVGYIRDNISRIFLKYQVKYNDVRRYHSLYYLDLLKISTLVLPDYANCSLDFVTTQSDHDFIASVLAQYNLTANQFVIVINSGGNQLFENSGIRMLPLSKILRLIKQLSIFKKVVLLGNKKDKIHYNNYLIKLNHNNVLNLAGELTLQQSAVLMRYASKIYTTDCGALHVAISQGLFKQLYCFFGPTHPAHVIPLDKGINYYYGDEEYLQVSYQLYGKLPLKTDYFLNLDIDQIIINTMGVRY